MTPSIPLKASPPIAMTLALALLTLSTLPPAAAQADYAFRQLVATGGHPVQGVEDGVILSQELAEDCRLVTDVSDPDDRPIAATVSTTVDLEVSIMSCLKDPAGPAVHCSWRIRGPKSAESAKKEKSWTGWKGTIAIGVPDKTGVYSLVLTCGIQGSDETVERTLYVTHDTPQQLLHDTAPEIAWYRKACTWGQGFGNGIDKETEILRTLLDGIYRYGQQNWKYGYLEKNQDGGYMFNNHQVLDADQAREVGLVCSGSSDEWCKCPWTVLVSDDSPCDVGDCYMFADVFQNMAATLGIGGLTEFIITGLIEGSGEKGQGFSTPSKARSLDPKFPANVLCKAPCPSYVFTTHSVRQRDGKYYDPTFNFIYDAPSGAIDLRIEEWLPNAAVFENQQAVMCIVSTGGYGGWYFYSYTPQTGVASCSQDTRESAAFTGSVDFSIVDLDEERVLIEELVADVEVEILTGGEYVVQGALFSGDQLIAHRQSWETKRFAAERISGEPGKYNVRLHFSGEEIYRSQIHGPYQFRASISGERGVADTLTVKTPPYRFFFFGEESSEILKVETDGVDVDVDGIYEAMVVTVELNVRRPGVFVLEARLAQQGQTIAEVARRVPLVPGKRPRTVKLRFPGRLIARQGGVQGPYELTVHHLGEDFSSIGSRLVTLRDFRAAQFK